jgi:hypothetical protein
MLILFRRKLIPKQRIRRIQDPETSVQRCNVGFNFDELANYLRRFGNHWVPPCLNLNLLFRSKKVNHGKLPFCKKSCLLDPRRTRKLFALNGISNTLNSQEPRNVTRGEKVK